MSLCLDGSQVFLLVPPKLACLISSVISIKQFHQVIILSSQTNGSPPRSVCVFPLNPAGDRRSLSHLMIVMVGMLDAVAD